MAVLGTACVLLWWFWPRDSEISEKCQAKVDVMFVLDGSASIGKNDFNLQLEFVQLLISELPLGVDATRVGVVQFSTDADLNCPLNGDKRVLNCVDNIKQLVGGTEINKGLQLACDELKKDTRPDTDDQIVILMADGHGATDIDLARKIVKQIAAPGDDVTGRVFTVAVGTSIDEEILKSLATDPKYFFHSQEGFTGLANLLRPIMQPIMDVSCENPDDEESQDMSWVWLLLLLLFLALLLLLCFILCLKRYRERSYEKPRPPPPKPRPPPPEPVVPRTPMEGSPFDEEIVKRCQVCLKSDRRWENDSDAVWQALRHAVQRATAQGDDIKFMAPVSGKKDVWEFVVRYCESRQGKEMVKRQANEIAAILEQSPNWSEALKEDKALQKRKKEVLKKGGCGCPAGFFSFFSRLPRKV